MLQKNLVRFGLQSISNRSRNRSRKKSVSQKVSDSLLFRFGVWSHTALWQSQYYLKTIALIECDVLKLSNQTFLTPTFFKWRILICDEKRDLYPGFVKAYSMNFIPIDMTVWLIEKVIRKINDHWSPQIRIYLSPCI